MFDCTSGIIFLGTPHPGSSLAAVAQRLARLLSVSKSRMSLRILKALQRDSEVLSRIQSDFCAPVQSRNQDDQTQKLQIVCFFEELPFLDIGDVMVSNEPAVLPAHHRDMVRFESEDSPGFESVPGELRRVIEDTDPPPEYDGAVPDPAPEGQRQRLKGRKRRSGNGSDNGIIVWGNVVGSKVVTGDLTIHGDLQFS